MDAARRATRSGSVAALLGAAGALLLWALFHGGASGSGATAGIGSAAVVAATLLLVGWAGGRVTLPRLDRYGLVAAAAAIALVAWTGLTVWWSIAGDRSFGALGKGIGLLAFAVVGLAVAALPGRPLRSLALLVAAALGVVLCWTLLGKAVPALGPDDAGRVARLRGPIGYWNALALLADASLGLGLWLVVSVRERLGRPLGALLLYVAALAVLLTQSRAGLVGGVAVVALSLWLTTERIEAALFALLACGPGLAVAGWAFTRPALVEDGGASAARVSDGAFLGVVAVVGAIVALVLVGRVPVERLVASRRRAVVRSLLGAVAVVVTVGLLGLVAAVGNPVTWATSQLSSSAEVDNGPGHLSSFETNNRTVWWGEAWQVFRANPAGGTGASTFEIARKRVRDNARNVTQPHSVPLQLLSDTGLPGFLLGLAFVGGLVLGIRATLGRLVADEHAAAVGLVGLPFAFGLHALVDLDLDFLAVAAPTSLVCAALLGAARPAAARAGRVMAAGVVVAALAALWVLVAPELSNRAIEAAYRQSSDGEIAAALSSAGRAQRLNPLSVEPLNARATVAGLAHDEAAAERFLVQATRLQPENPATWYDLGLFRYLAGDLCGAYYAFNSSYTLDPRNSRFHVGSEFDRAKDAVNDRDDPACGR